VYGSTWVAIFNLKCNMQNDNAIFKMALHSMFKFTFYIYILKLDFHFAPNIARMVM